MNLQNIAMTRLAGASRLLTALLLGLIVAPGLSPVHAAAPEAPLTLPLNNVSLKIVAATYVTALSGTNGRFEENDPKNYHGLVLTVEIKKPAGDELTLIAQDISLHYRYGEKSDVAPCLGLSTYSAQLDVDRSMSFFKNGIGRSVTGLSTTKMSTVFVDMFFQYMEPDSSDLHLLVAQPVGATFKTTGWK